MANRVNVNITARDLTRGQLARIRHNFSRLDADLNRAVGNRSRSNFQRLNEAINQSRRDLNAMRGAIPDAEFRRLDNALQRAQRRMRQGFDNVDDQTFRRIQREVQRVNDGFRDLDRNGQIRVRVDTSALRRADARLDAWRRTQTARPVRPRVDPDVDRSWSRRITGVITAPFRRTGAVVGGILSDGIGQGIVQGFQGGGPVGAAIFAGVLLSLMAWLGAALSGLLVSALALAFISIAGISAAQSKEVKAQWSSTLESLKENFTSVGEPLIPVLTRGIRLLEQMADKAAPIFREAMVGAVPATNQFIDNVLDGVKRMAKKMFKPIMDAWDVFGPVFGDVLGDSFEMFGESFADMANLVRNHSGEIEIALRGVFWVIDKLIDTVTFFGKIWVFLLTNMAEGVGGLLKYAIRPLVTGIFEAFQKIAEGAELAFGWVPGVGDDLRTGLRKFKEFKEGVYDTLDSTAEAALNWDNNMNRLNKARVLKADISKWSAQLAEAKRKLKEVPPEKRAKLKANIADLQAKVRQARAELAKVQSKTVYLRTIKEIITYSKQYRSVHDIVGKATGGNIGAAATGGARRNRVLVGEQGPEIVELPGGSRVRSNSDTRRVMNDIQDRGVGGATIRLMIDAGPSETSRLLLKLLRNAIRVEGGDVELVLGRNS